ncbi:MAG: OmpA family protein [Bacteroidota bacterium]|nr:OmpA family protein [Bacteroidota bacterium]
MYKISLTIFLLIIIVFPALSQQNEEKLVNIKGHADCMGAMKISTENTFGPTNAPEGYGKKLEFSGNKIGNKYFFEKEHNTVWYKFIILYDGFLVFDIIPTNVNDDYDFSIYKYKRGNFCKEIIDKEVMPIRTNISRNSKSINSKTGLSFSAKVNFKDAGKGVSYSKALKVTKGTIYYLVLDNVYENGAGHTIKFKYKKEDGSSAVVHEITGNIIDEKTNEAIESEVVIEDANSGIVLATVQTDKKTGKFTFTMPEEFDLNREYNISVYSKGHFFKDMRIVPANAKKTGGLKNVKLSELKKGKIFSVSNIIFYGNSPQYLPQSKPTLERLLKLMKENENLEIAISGHINGCTGSPEGRQLLSEARAQTVHTFLVKRGIEKARLTSKGFGCTKMIYPNPKNEEEKRENRRVEVEILKL